MSVGKATAERILRAALAEGRADEFIQCLFDGGSATLDRDDKLILVGASELKLFMDRANNED